MKRGIRIPGHLQDLIRHLAPELKRKIRMALEEIAENSESGKPLKEDLQGFKSYKLGQFRIVYREASPSTIEITGIGPRTAIYQRMILEIRQRQSGEL